MDATMAQDLLVHAIAMMAFGYLAFGPLRPRRRRARAIAPHAGDCASGCAGCALSKLNNPAARRRTRCH